MCRVMECMIVLILKNISNFILVSMIGYTKSPIILGFLLDKLFVYFIIFFSVHCA